MDNTLLFEGEEIITFSEDKVLTLTNKRLRYNDSNYGKAHIVSIHLEKISSIEIHYSSRIWLLVLGIVVVAASMIMVSDGKEEFFSGAILGLIMIIVFLFTRKHLVTIASDGGAKINFHTKGMKREILLLFINKIEKAKSLINNK